MTNNQQGHSRQYSAGERYRQGRERGRAVKHLVDIPLDRPQFIDPAFFSESGASISAVIALTEGDAILQEPQFFHPLSEDLSGDYSPPDFFPLSFCRLLWDIFSQRAEPF